MNRNKLVKEADNLLRNYKKIKSSMKGELIKKTKKKKKPVAVKFYKTHKTLISLVEKSTQSDFAFQVENILKATGLEYKKEGHHNKLVNPKTGKPLFIDFYIHSIRLAIEVDGSHHRFPIHGEEKLKYQKYKDCIKNKFCKNHKILMLRLKTSEPETFQYKILSAIERQKSRPGKVGNTYYKPLPL